VAGDVATTGGAGAGATHALPSPPEAALKIYDTMGWLGLMVSVYFGGGLLGRLIWPVLGFFDSVLLLVTRSR